jgi:hypothetical protein
MVERIELIMRSEMKHLLIIISVAFCFAAKSAELIEGFDLRTYDPVNNGLKDFSCEIRLKGLTDRLKNELVSLNIKDEVYYKLYWIYPGKLDLVVEGLPRGFKELRTNLKNLIVNRIDYLVPQKLGKRIRGYDLETQNTSSGTLVKGKDPANNKAVNKIELLFDKEGKLKAYKSYSPLGFQQSTFSYTKKSWSKNKWVLNEVKAKTIQGPQVTEIDTEIEHNNFVGFGFPERITISTTQYVVAPGKEEKKQERTGQTELSFSNYKINAGEATKHFRN